MFTLRTLLRVSLLALAALASTACESIKNPFAGDPADTMPDAADYVTGLPIEVPEYDFLWERTKFLLATERYGMDLVRTNRPERLMVSRWKTLLAPSRYKGVRRRVVCEFVDAGPGTYVVRLAVQVQRNEDLDSPMEPSGAVWKDQPADLERARVLLFKVESGF